jgi:hypothetical protein
MEYPRGVLGGSSAAEDREYLTVLGISTVVCNVGGRVGEIGPVETVLLDCRYDCRGPRLILVCVPGTTYLAH